MRTLEARWILAPGSLSLGRDSVEWGQFPKAVPPQSKIALPGGVSLALGVHVSGKA